MPRWMTRSGMTGLCPYSIAPSPFLFRSLPRRITDVAGHLLLSQESGLALFLLGRHARSLFFHCALGSSSRFRRDHCAIGQVKAYPAMAKTR